VPRRRRRRPPARSTCVRSGASCTRSRWAARSRSRTRPSRVLWSRSSTVRVCQTPVRSAVLTRRSGVCPARGHRGGRGEAPQCVLRTRPGHAVHARGHRRRGLGARRGRVRARRHSTRGGVCTGRHSARRLCGAPRRLRSRRAASRASVFHCRYSAIFLLMSPPPKATARTTATATTRMMARWTRISVVHLALNIRISHRFDPVTPAH
jgi:hypothetical protein